MGFEVEEYAGVYLIKLDGVYHGGKYATAKAAELAQSMDADSMLSMWVQHYSTVGVVPLTEADVGGYLTGTNPT